MNKINLARVILGGLVAGVVLNIGEFLLNDVILGAHMREMFTRLGLPDPGGSFMAVAVTLTLILGIVIVWMYAAMRPRLGPGPKTAICAGLLVWFAVYLYSGVINGMVIGMPANVMLIALAWGAVQYTVAAMAGAWLYREE